MEIRILASELDDIDWDAHDPKAQAKKKAEAEKQAKSEADAKAVPGAEAEDAVAEPVSGGATTVEVSKLVRPGAALSGSVKFGSGSSADWYVDPVTHNRRLAVDGDPSFLDQPIGRSARSHTGFADVLVQTDSVVGHLNP